MLSISRSDVVGTTAAGEQKARAGSEHVYSHAEIYTIDSLVGTKPFVEELLSTLQWGTGGGVACC